MIIEHVAEVQAHGADAKLHKAGDHRPAMGLGHDLEVRPRAARRHVKPGEPHVLAGAVHEARDAGLLAAQADLVFRALLAATDLRQRGDHGGAEAVLRQRVQVDAAAAEDARVPPAHGAREAPEAAVRGRARLVRLSS
eukprot:8679899-Heterocapsa_arctica.AAC.1